MHVWFEIERGGSQRFEVSIDMMNDYGWGDMCLCVQWMIIAAVWVGNYDVLGHPVCEVVREDT